MSATSFSDTCSLSPFDAEGPCPVVVADYIKGSMCSNSSCSLNGENPYATIRDPPGLACKHTENSYVEMKSPSHREVPFGGTATLLASASRNVYDVGECWASSYIIELWGIELLFRAVLD